MCFVEENAFFALDMQESDEEEMKDGKIELRTCNVCEDVVEETGSSKGGKTG